MGFMLLLAILCGVYAGLNWLLIPRLERSWPTATIHAKYTKAAGIAALTTIRTFVQIAIWAAVVTLAVAILVWIGGRLGWKFSLDNLHEATGWVLGWLRSIGKNLGLAISWLALAALGWFAYRSARKGLRAELDREFAQQKEALVEEWQAGRLAELPQSPEMADCASTLISAQTLRDTLAQDPAANQASLAQIEDTIGKLFSHYVNLDLDRRVDLTSVPLPVDDGPGWWPKIRLFLFSKGTLSLGERTQKYVTRLTTAAACIAVVGVGAPVLANTAVAPLFASLTDLRVFASADDAAKSLSAYSRIAVQPPKPTELAEDDGEDFSASVDPYPRAAAQFVRAVADAQVWSSGVERSAPGTRVMAAASARQSRDVGDMMIREALLHEYVGARNGAGLNAEGLADPSDPQGKKRYDRLVAGVEADPAKQFPGLVDRVEGYLRAEGARSPGFEERLRAGLAEFRRPAGTWNYVSAALGDVVGDALKGALPEAGSDLAKFRPKVEQSAIKKGVERVVQIKLASFLENIRGGRSFTQSLRTVAAGNSPILRSAEAATLAGDFDLLERDAARLRERFASQSPSLRLGVSEAEKKRTQPFAKLVNEGVPPRQLAGALGNYDALFEGHAGSVSRTALAEIDSSLAVTANDITDALPPDGGNAPTAERRPPGRFQLARSSVAMGRSFRVGGVVFGAMPGTGPAALDFERLVWTRRGSAFDLALIDRQGRREEMGTFSGEMIQLALAYAADARTVAVTMTAPTPVLMPMLRVNLHPALIDTRLGAEIIALDRFVDEANFLCQGGATPSRRACEERDRVEEQLALYRIPNLMQRGAISAANASLMKDAATSVAAAFPAGWPATDPRVSVFAYHPLYFDQAAVLGLQKCAAGAGEAFGRCLEKESLNSLLATPPPSTIWSGVREPAYDLGSDWIGADNLRFMLQVAFDTSDPQGLDDGKAPWEFPAIADDVERDVKLLIARDGAHARIAATARQFVLLQRIFRLALTHHLGSNFEAADLVTLMRQAKRADPVVRVPTPQWSKSRGDAREQALTLRNALRDGQGDPEERQILELSLGFIEANLADPAVRFTGD